MPRLSVIIPTHGRPELLRDLVGSIQAQRIDPRALDVLVVDDGSPEPVGVPAGRGPIEVRCLRVPQRGLGAARNLGVRETCGELVAFLDDDTLLSPGWAQAVIRAFDADGCAGLGGRVELRFEAPAPKWLSRRQRAYLAEFDLGAEPCWLDDGVAPVGANCAARRTEIHRVGGFREDLDRRAGSLVSNGDTEFFRRLRARGGRLRYEPAALAWHRVGPERLTREFVRRRAYAQGVSDVLVDGEAPLVRELWRYGRAAPILLRGIATRRGTINAVQWVNYCRGRLDAGRRR